METSSLLKYLEVKTSEKETEKIQKWLADDPDGSHAELYQEVRAIYEGITVFGEAPNAGKSSFNRRSPSIMKIAAAAIVVVAVALGSSLYSGYHSREKMSRLTETISTPAGQTVQLSLEDGTALWMNAATQIEKPAVFAPKHRTLALSNGEILLDVAKDESRPFHVKTPSADIQVFGTRFDVSVENGNTCLALIRGSVRISSDKGNSLMVKPYEKVYVDEDGYFVISKFTDANAIESWTGGIIDLVGVPFDELMKKFEKAFDTTILIKCKDMPEIKLARGKVRIIDGVEHALGVLKHGADFRYTIDYNNNVITIL